MATCPSFRRFPPEWLTGTACGYDKKTNTFKRFCCRPNFNWWTDLWYQTFSRNLWRHGMCVHHPWNCKTKACNCYWHAWGEPTIRHNSAIALHRINRILHRERDCKGPFAEPDIGSFQNRNDFQVLDLHKAFFTVTRTSTFLLKNQVVWTSLLDCSVVEMHVKHDEWWHPESSRGRRPPACIFDVAGHAHWLLETLDRELEKKNSAGLLPNWPKIDH